jgi:hypothetical protein
MVEKRYKAVGIGFILALLLATSFTGGSGLIGYKWECINGIDDDGDQNSINGGTDGNDFSCFEYPFNDGNGETDTPLNERYTSNNDYSSLFGYHRDYGGVGIVCDAYGAGYYDQLPEQKAEANIFLDESGFPRFNCPP